MDVDSHNANNADGASTPAIVPKPYDPLWFPDGNVVLATDKFLFRVHKSVLSLHSSVFRDMFGLPTLDGPIAGGMTPEMCEGLPLVTLAGDKGDDMMHLLHAAYERRYYQCDDDDTPIELITALLQLSAKYDFKDIHSDVVKHLLQHYPTTLHEYDVAGSDPFTPMFGVQREDCHDLLLKAAFTANTEILLPTLYYACSDYPTDYYLSNNFVPLFLPCSQKLLHGKLALTEGIQLVACLYVEKSEACVRIHRSRRDDVGSLLQMQRLMNTCDLSEISWKNLERRWPRRVCAECKGALETRIEEERVKIWDKIPSFFGLSDWRALRANYAG